MVDNDALKAAAQAFVYGYPLVYNLTETRKIVSSEPRPTLMPGKNLVPRWRTMMEPAGMVWPPNALTPSRWPLLSRPFVVEPWDFVEAMAYPLCDFFNLNLGLALAVTLLLTVTLLGAPFINDQFGTAELIHHRGGHF